MVGFDRALTAMLLGTRVRRSVWHLDDYVFQGQPNCVAARGPVLAVLIAQGIGKDRMRPGFFRVSFDEAGDAWLSMWIPSAEDLLAQDWEPAPEVPLTAPLAPAQDA